MLKSDKAAKISFDIGRFCPDSFQSFPSQNLSLILKLTLRKYFSFSKVFMILREYNFCTTFYILIDDEKPKIDTFDHSQGQQ